MLNSNRWMLWYDGAESKQPFSVHEEAPPEYKPGKNSPRWYRTQWGESYQWASIEVAVQYAAENPKFTHLCFVLRDEDRKEKLRFIAFDFDGCFDADGQLDPAVANFLHETQSFAERSKSGRGLHVVASYYGKPFKSKYKIPFGDCKVDVITSGQIVTTGDVFRNAEVETIDIAFVQHTFDVREKIATGDGSDCWSVECKFDKPYLSRLMLDWPLCCRSTKGSTYGDGGDTEFFKAACELARHGVTGDAARDLLGLVRVDPVPFSDNEVNHKIESAFKEVNDREEQFGAYHEGRVAAASQFGAVEYVELPDDPEAPVGPVPGFEGLELAQHFHTFSLDNMPDYIIHDTLFEEGALMIGGQNKTFKTTIGLDLLLSLATLKPFLNSFPIECEPKSVAIFSSETREFLMTQYLSTILEAKGLHVEDVKKSFTINSRVPAFMMGQNGKMVRQGQFERYLKKHKPDIVFFDPLYRMFAGVNQADISSMGQALEYVEQTCIDNGAMPIFCHHSRKPSTLQGGEFPIMTLNDLSGAGGGAFCRQWMLLSHTRPYSEGSARLHATVGASGAVEKKWIIDLETRANEKAVWKASASRASIREEVQHKLIQGGRTTINQLAKALKSSEAKITQAVVELEERGLCTQVNNGVQPISNLTGDQEV